MKNYTTDDKKKRGTGDFLTGCSCFVKNNVFLDWNATFIATCQTAQKFLKSLRLLKFLYNECHNTTCEEYVHKALGVGRWERRKRGQNERVIWIKWNGILKQMCFILLGRKPIVGTSAFNKELNMPSRAASVPLHSTSSSSHSRTCSEQNRYKMRA